MKLSGPPQSPGGQAPLAGADGIGLPSLQLQPVLDADLMAQGMSALPSPDTPEILMLSLSTDRVASG
jgi:hypothetical protein